MKKEYAVDYEKFIDVNGDRQNIRVRAAREGLKPILFLHGGPGVADRHIIMMKQSALAEKYALICWDQRGSGKSYRPDIKKEELSLETYISDAEAVLDYVRAETGYDRVIVAGHSWGTIIGTPLAARAPEKIAAYIAQGLFVEGAENELLSWKFCLDEAERTGNKKAVNALSGIRPENGRYPNDKAMMTQRNYLSKFGGGVWKERKGLVASLIKPLIKSGEYSPREIINYASGALYLSKKLWDYAVEQDYTSITRLEVPVIVTQGVHDYNTPSEIACRWFDRLTAPFKKWIDFEESAHSPIVEESDKWRIEVEKALLEAGL